MTTHGVPFAIASSAVGWMLGILGLLIWMLFHPREDFGAKILILIMVFLAIGPVCNAVMNAENASFPLKFDWFLYVVDQNLGISAFSLARVLAEWQRSVLFQIYESLTLAMVAWYGINLRTREGRPNRLLIAYAVTFLVGPPVPSFARVRSPACFWERFSGGESCCFARSGPHRRVAKCNPFTPSHDGPSIRAIRGQEPGSALHSLGVCRRHGSRYSRI